MKRIVSILFMALVMFFVASPASAINDVVEYYGDHVLIRDADGNVFEIYDLGGGSFSVMGFDNQGYMVYYAYVTDSDNSTNNVWINGQYYNGGKTPSSVDRFYYYSPFDGKTHMIENYKVKNPKGKNANVKFYK